MNELSSEAGVDLRFAAFRHGSSSLKQLKKSPFFERARFNGYCKPE